MKKSVPKGAKIVGDYHTHGDYSYQDAKGKIKRVKNAKLDNLDSDLFSPDDIPGVKKDGKGIAGYKGYLGTPSGKFKSVNRLGKVMILK